MPKTSREINKELSKEGKLNLEYYKKETEKYQKMIENYKPVSKKVLKKFGNQMRKFFASKKFKK